ncbi:hypothetical protein [Frankia sp. AvcI1]|uniref:hypothetical protein n=1 Tax=Frankia sp. AvcI1 TaxID=573496 RepID=UPI002118150D|nr:hypothetical protein [Frankia sp. AvcI1]
MALVSTQQVAAPGTTITYAAAGAGETIIPGERTTVRIRNGSGASITVTLAGVQPCSQGGTHDRVVTVPAGGDADLPTGPAVQFANTSTGQASLTYSSTSSVTRAVVGV